MKPIIVGNSLFRQMNSPFSKTNSLFRAEQNPAGSSEKVLKFQKFAVIFPVLKESGVEVDRRRTGLLVDLDKQLAIPL